MSFERIFDSVTSFLERKLENKEELKQLLDELKATVSDLIANRHLPIKKRLQSLFVRFSVPENLAASLTTSLATGIEKERGESHEITYNNVENLHLPNLRKQQELVVARIGNSIPDLNLFSAEKILDMIEESAIPLAQLLGSNVAEALSIADPSGVFRSRLSILQCLHGQLADPISIGNLFTQLGDSQKQTLVSLLSEKITDAKSRYSSRRENLLRLGKIEQWIYERLREHYIPDKTAQEIAPLIIKEHRVEELEQMNERQFRKMIIKIISNVSSSLTN